MFGSLDGVYYDPMTGLPVGAEDPNPRGLLEAGNIDLNKRPVVKNADGTISTVRTRGFNFGDNKETNIPTVSPDGKILSDEDAIKLYKDTGQHLGKFDIPGNADAAAQQLHEEQAVQYVPPKPRPPEPLPHVPGREEMSTYNPSFSERVGNVLQDALMGLGADPYKAGHVAHGIRDVAQFTPAGVPMALGDLKHSMNEGDITGAALAAAGGLMPAAKPIARAIEGEVRPAIRALTEAHPAHSPELQQAYHAEMGPDAGQAAYDAYLLAHGEPPNVAKIPAAGETQAGGAVGRDVAAGAGGGAPGVSEAQAAAARRAGAHQPLEGLPSKAMLINGEHFVPGPIGTVKDVAEQYMAARPTPSYHTLPTKYHPLDEEHSANIARAFDEMAHNPNDPATKASYDAMINETADQYKAIKATGLKIEPIPAGMADPYAANPRLAAKDVADNNHLWFFPTEGGFGTVNKVSDNPMLRATGEKIGGHEMLANDMFRVVHDYFGHLKEGHGFRAGGEDNAWRSHAAMYSDLARPAMTTETRGQNSWVNYGPHGEANRKASGADTVYADQKVGLMPEWTMRDRGSPEPIIVHHASPYAFNQFDTKKIGAGEGNQAFGHGLYFAEHSPVTDWYKHQLAPRRDPLLKEYGLDSEQGANMGVKLSQTGGDVKPLIAELRADVEKLKGEVAGGDTSKATRNMIETRENQIGYLNDPERNTGQKYEVAIDHPPQHFLDHDKPFSEQSAHVQEKVRPVIEKQLADARKAIEPMLESGMRGQGTFRRAIKPDELARMKEVMNPDYINSISGADIYKRMGLPAKDAREGFLKSSQALQEAGIPGVRYLDEGSRGTAGGTSNYVTFQAPRILKREGHVPLTKDIPAPKFDVPPLKRGFNQGVENPPDMMQTVADPHRNMFPGVYGNPKELAAEAASRVAPEDPALKRLWGVDRGDLDAMAKGRVGNEKPVVEEAGGRSRGALSAQNIQTPKNTQRLQDILGEAGKKPGLAHADAWYVMDPVYKRMVELFGPKEAPARYKKFNTMMGMASPGSDVMTEIQRGTLAHAKSTQGKFGEFEKFAGVPEEFRSRTAHFPEDMRYVAGHPYHRTSQAGPMAKYLEHGSIQSDAPKVPLYVQASGVPETGFQTAGPVGDAHFSRGVGLTDTRKGPSDVQGSFSKSEYQTLQPWWQHEVAGKVGLESVPAQARLWTALGPQTGVSSPLGQGKLELLSRQIVNAAKRLRITPERARDLILEGKIGAGVLAGAAAGPAAFGALDTRQEKM